MSLPPRRLTMVHSSGTTAQMQIMASMVDTFDTFPKQEHGEIQIGEQPERELPFLPQTTLMFKAWHRSLMPPEQLLAYSSHRMDPIVIMVKAWNMLSISRSSLALPSLLNIRWQLRLRVMQTKPEPFNRATGQSLPQMLSVHSLLRPRMLLAAPYQKTLT